MIFDLIAEAKAFIYLVPFIFERLIYFLFFLFAISITQLVTVFYFVSHSVFL